MTGNSVLYKSVFTYIYSLGFCNPLELLPTNKILLQLNCTREITRVHNDFFKSPADFVF